MMDIWEALRAPFPREAIHWRAQTLNKDGDKALALAYIDARDVMRRLDDVVGPPHWQDSFTETPKGRVICSLSIFYEGAWITKSDGAGDTDVEGEKGGISDALKRAAVKWGIGRYLYDMPAPWVPCESYDTGQKDRFGNTRWGFRKWSVDPWTFVRNEPSTETDAARIARDRALLEAAENRDTLVAQFGRIYHGWNKNPPAELVELKNELKAKFPETQETEE